MSYLLTEGLSDFDSFSTLVFVEPSQFQLNRLCVDVNITQDDILERNESFLVLFTTSDPSVIVNSGVSTVFIIDDDCKLHSCKIMLYSAIYLILSMQ